MNAVTFANCLGQLLAPVLLAIRATGFFEWWVYIPTMTVVAALAYLGLLRRHRRAGASTGWPLARHGLHFLACWLGANALAVAFKTLIVQEMDYTEPVWFAGLVSPLHFYIASVTAAYLWIVTSPGASRAERAGGLYVEIGLFAGCTVGIHRLHTEPFTVSDITSGIGGLVILALCITGMVEVWRTALRRA